MTVSVFCKLSFIVCCCWEWPSSLEKLVHLVSKPCVSVFYLLHTNRKPLDDGYLLMLGTNRCTDREQYTKSNAATERPLTLVKPAETLPRDWLNTNERQEMVISAIALLNTIYRRNIKSRLGLCDMYYFTMATNYQRLTISRKLVY